MTRKYEIFDEHTGQALDRDKDKIYTLDVATGMKVGKDRVFIKGRIDLSHKTYMEVPVGKIKVPFKQWVKHSKAEIAQTDEKGHWEEFESPV